MPLIIGKSSKLMENQLACKLGNYPILSVLQDKCGRESAVMVTRSSTSTVGRAWMASEARRGFGPTFGHGWRSRDQWPAGLDGRSVAREQRLSRSSYSPQ
jgi:hypothetical protein